MADPVKTLREMFAAALRAADPRICLPAALPEKPAGGCVVVGCGKASALMAQVLEDAWPDIPLRGVVVTRYGHAVPTRHIRILEAGHPVPDANSVAAGAAILDAVRGLTAADLVICLISGGGSALMVQPAPGLTLADKQAITRALLASGAPIAHINAVRRALSAIKGGRLAAAAAPARVVTLAISDVPGDDPSVIASGPTVPPPTGEDAGAILRRHGIRLPAGAVLSPPPDLAPADFRLIATPSMSLAAAAQAARAAGITPLILGDAIEGEAREAARVLAGIALSCRTHATPAAAPCVLLSGGETTVTLGAARAGRGGRNTEFALALACALRDAPGIFALACDTDGIDGTEDAAGAIITPDTLARAAAAGLDARGMLDAHDSYSLFAALDNLIVTGPTLTNVNDFRAILVT